MKINILENKKVLLLGIGLTTFETAMVLEEYREKLVLVDGDLDGNDYVEDLRAKKYNIKSTDEFLENNEDIDIIIKSPGIPFNNKILLKYKEVKVINDIELAYMYIKENNLPIKTVAVTGTNGKTSTTLFLEKFLRESGYKVASAGNIGVSPLTILNTSLELDFLVIEISSFQLMNVDKFKPEYSFILNITPDHINVHGSFEEYAEAKKRLYMNQTEEDYLFVKRKVYEQFLKDEELKVNLVINEADAIVIEELDFYKCSGINFNNLLLCYKFGEILNIDRKYFFNTMNKFEGLEHRVEFVDCINGINFYNDSKATNLAATKESVKYLENIIILVGGRSKGEDLSKLDDYISDVKYVICFGENRKEFKSEKIIKRFKTLEEAVMCAKMIAKEGDSVLLSPASTSHDQYKNYQVRGMHFKKLIKDIW